MSTQQTTETVVAEAQLIAQVIEILRAYKRSRHALKGAVAALKATEEFVAYQIALKMVRASKKSLDETVDTLKV